MNAEDKETINKFMNESISNFYIKKFFVQKLQEQCKIMTYTELSTIGNIDDLFNGVECVFILVREYVDSGHWIIIYKYKNTINVFDSYSSDFIDDEITKVKKNKLVKKQNYPYMTKLLINGYNKGYEIHYNEFKVQKGGKISTCGRHCIVRYIFKDLDEKDYYYTLNRLSQLTNMSLDELVTYLTLIILFGN